MTINTLNNIKRRMLAALNKGKMNKSALTMSVRDHLAKDRNAAFDCLQENGMVETCTPALGTAGRPPTWVRITNKGKKELKQLTKGEWK